jgi:hypothetical protein
VPVTIAGCEGHQARWLAEAEETMQKLCAVTQGVTVHHLSLSAEGR